MKIKQYCAECNKEILGRRKKIYCNNKCHATKIKKAIYEKIESGAKDLYVTQYRNYLIYKHGAKCMDCNWDKINPKSGKCPIQLEHIDGNSLNNNLNNLKLLCPNCHSLTPTYMNLNKGNGRHARRVRYAEGKSS